MIDSIKFSIVDVFAEIKYTGNQLAVIWGDGVESLSDEEMLKIAQEMNYRFFSYGDAMLLNRKE